MPFTCNFWKIISTFTSSTPLRLYSSKTSRIYAMRAKSSFFVPYYQFLPYYCHWRCHRGWYCTGWHRCMFHRENSSHRCKYCCTTATLWISNSKYRIVCAKCRVLLLSMEIRLDDSQEVMIVLVHILKRRNRKCTDDGLLRILLVTDLTTHINEGTLSIPLPLSQAHTDNSRRSRWVAPLRFQNWDWWIGWQWQCHFHQTRHNWWRTCSASRFEWHPWIRPTT